MGWPACLEAGLRSATAPYQQTALLPAASRATATSTKKQPDEAHKQMTFTEHLARAEQHNNSMLCIGLDPDPGKFPGAWKGDASRIFDFCAAIVDATRDLAIAFKPQIAYFAAHRAEAQLEALIGHIHSVAPNVPVILDAKRGDIGSTAEQYAREVFERYEADAVTLSPFMGFDSIEPYLAYAGKGVILLCRTSNPGGGDLQGQVLAGGDKVFERIARLAHSEWNSGGQVALVVGATFPAEIERVRELAPTLPLLIPGIGAQGGDAAATVRAGWRGANGHTTAPIIVSSSRAVLYASQGDDFAAAARGVALATRQALNDAR
ncbi:orotidine-5'-phosphate decarboxylase [soil metagenome]